MEFLPSFGLQIVPRGQIGLILWCRPWMRCLGCLKGPESTSASKILCPRHLMHLPLELTLDPKLVGDPLNLHPSLTGPPTTCSSLPLSVPLCSRFPFRIVIWRELHFCLSNLNSVLKSLPPYIPHHFPSSHPPPSPFNWIISLGLLLQFCLIAIRPPPKGVLLKSLRQNLFIVTENAMVSDSSVFIVLFTSLLY